MKFDVQHAGMDPAWTPGIFTPAAVAAAIEGMPAWVAGILMSAFGRSSNHHKALASAVVLSVSLAMRGSTSSETRPSMPSVASYTGRRTSQPQRMS